MHALHTAVSALMNDVAQSVVMPYFQSLTAEQIIEKSPGDLVTVADRLSEERLTEGLMKILPGSRVVGEEAVAADAAVLEGIDSGTVWIVDPIDGTGNYAGGRTPFAIMVGLAEDGEVVGGWILDPVKARMLHGVKGGGAFVNDERVTSRGSDEDVLIGALAPRYLPKHMRGDMEARTKGKVQQADIPRCAGEQYPRIVSGENDFAIFWRSHPWDHAPGSLFLTEAGGRIARWDGAPYRIGEKREGLLAAATPAIWDKAAAIING
ncbi:inositol monophosphatase family protein [Sphingomonas sp. ID0503]|uniref:inositol monophosphatase family protein n=1 Tax=Sphingomonas sp. ID0503 TaxID=3399691 RepID=UPI003AFA972D